jgi:hypothetical protein
MNYNYIILDQKVKQGDHYAYQFGDDYLRIN